MSRLRRLPGALPGAARKRGFTLLEILVGVALLVVIAVLIAQLVSATSSATRLSNRGIDAAAQARLAFDRIGLDLSARVRRRDVDFMISTNSVGAGPPYPLMFLSEVTSATPQGVASTNNRGISLVAYQIATNADTPRPSLLRAGKALVWTNAGFTGYQTNWLPVPLEAIPVTLSAGDFDALAPAVIRMIIGYQLYPDNEEVRLLDNRTIAHSRGQIVYSPPVLFDANDNPTAQIDLGRISAFIVGLVCLDPEALKLATAAQITTLVGKFPTPGDGELPVALWSPIAENVSTLPNDIPLPVRQSLRVFQRAFPINPYQNAP